MNARSWKKFSSQPMAVLCIRNRLCRSFMKLAGYDLGRSDLVRRAMSKKKADVMAKERQYFVYGNEELGVPGCIANGIDEASSQQNL